MYSTCCVKNLWYYIFPFSQDNVERQKLDNLAQKFTTFGITNIRTLIGYCLPNWITQRTSKYSEMKAFFKDFFATFEKQYAEHEKTYDPNCIRDFVDAYIAERKRFEDEQDTESSFYGQAGHWNFVNSIFDLFLAGKAKSLKTLQLQLLN